MPASSSTWWVLLLGRKSWMPILMCSLWTECKRFDLPLEHYKLILSHTLMDSKSGYPSKATWGAATSQTLGVSVAPLSTHQRDAFIRFKSILLEVENLRYQLPSSEKCIAFAFPCFFFTSGNECWKLLSRWIWTYVPPTWDKKSNWRYDERLQVNYIVSQIYWRTISSRIFACNWA